MPAATFTTMAPFQMVLFGKNPVPLLRKVKIALFRGNDLFHVDYLNYGCHGPARSSAEGQ